MSATRNSSISQNKDVPESGLMNEWESQSGLSLILVYFPKICHHLCCEAAAEMQQLVMCVTLSQIMSSVCLFTSFPLDAEFSHCFWEFRCEEISWSIFICVVALHTLCYTMVENCLKNSIF